ncbi:MAG: hypothetical protein ACK518_03965 [bacterium]|jgi:hypothetical protein
MSIDHINQIFPGARKPNYNFLYVTGGITALPTATVSSDAITFDGGAVEFDGISIPFSSLSLDFGNLGSLVAEGQRYIISAVPSYLEPADRTAAVSANVRYFVEYDSKRQAIARFFINPALVSAVDALGGINTLRQKVINGVSTTAETIAFNNYEQERVQFTDRRFAPEVLRPTGVRLILDQIIPQTNAPSNNVLDTFSSQQIAELQAQVPEIQARRLVLTKAAAVAKYNTAGKNILIKPGTAFHFASEANANAGVSGTAITDITNINAVSGTHVALYEYYMPSNMDRAQVASEPDIVRRLTVAESALLGRVNPIYLENVAPMADIASEAFARLTKYASPVKLVDVSLGNNLGVTINSSIYTRLF